VVVVVLMVVVLLLMMVVIEDLEAHQLLKLQPRTF